MLVPSRLKVWRRPPLWFWFAVPLTGDPSAPECRSDGRIGRARAGRMRADRSDDEDGERDGKYGTGEECGALLQH